MILTSLFENDECCVERHRRSQHGAIGEHDVHGGSYSSVGRYVISNFRLDVGAVNEHRDVEAGEFVK